MAQNIYLRDRVRFLPTTKKKDLPPMFDSIFVGTVEMAFNGTFSLWYPSGFADWQENFLQNYKTLIGERDNSGDGGGLISEIDYNIWNIGNAEGVLYVINPSVRNEYPFYYGEYTKDDGSHSGLVYYTLYNFEPVGYITDNPKPAFKMSIDIWESKVNINDATAYEDIQ
jgi:hypothetical protein